jgi:hypothetical protein
VCEGREEQGSSHVEENTEETSSATEKKGPPFQKKPQLPTNATSSGPAPRCEATVESLWQGTLQYVGLEQTVMMAFPWGQYEL